MLTYQAMNNSDDMVVLLERDGGAQSGDAAIIGCNAAFRRASGYADEQLLGLAATDLFPAEDDAETLRNAIRGRGAPRSELACNRASGGTFMLGMHLMPAPARTPGRDCFVLLGRDITATLQVRQIQESTQRLLAKVFASVDAAVAIISSAGHIVMTNPSIDLLLGYGPNRLIGKSSLELVSPGSHQAVAAILKRQFEDGSDASYSVPVLRADGSQLPVRITSVIAATSESKKFQIITLRPEAIGTALMRTQSVARITLVGLDEARAALADRWPAAAERAMATAEVVIKRHQGREDSYWRADDTSFLMCFGTLNEEGASYLGAMIGREVRSRLIGQGESPDNSYVRSIAAVLRFPDRGESETALRPLLLDGLDQQLERLEREARQTLRDASVSTAGDLEPVLGRNAAQVVASQVVIPDALERRLNSALAALPRIEADAFDRDALLIGLAAQHAVTSTERGDTTPVLVTISFGVFATRASTERFFTMCTKIDRRATTRLVLLLSSLPNGLPRTRLQDCVSRLRPFCRGVGYQVDEVADLPEIDRATSFNPIVVLPVTACGASTPGRLRELFMSLQIRRAKVLIRGVGSEQEAAALRSLGVDMISMKRPAD